MTMNLELLIGVLASIVPLITYIVSTITAHVQLSNYIGLVGTLYFMSSYVTFILFIGFLVVVTLAALNILKNYQLMITLTCVDGAVMVTAGASLYISLFVSPYTGAGVGMFVGIAVLLLVKIFHILPLTFELFTKGLSLWNTRNEESMLQKNLPFAIYGALSFGFIASLVYTVAALAVAVKCYAQTDVECYYSASYLFQYSLPLFIFLQMMVVMFFFVQFKWKRGVHTFAVLSSFLLLILGYALNMMAFQLYAYTGNEGLRNEDISMTVASIFMILITIFVNMAWPVLYNLRNQTGNEESNSTLPVPYNLHNPTANEETNITLPVPYNLHNQTGNEETNSTLPVPYNLHNPTANEDTKQLLD